MASKSSFNDYSALGNLFRDGALGLVISTGITSTLLPNTVESIGQFRELNSFATLNLFSVIYFIFPVLLMTSYWFMRGSRLYFVEKLDSSETARYKELGDKAIEKNDWWRLPVIFAKLLPIFIFISSDSFFENKGILLGILYFSLGFIQIYANYEIARRWLGEKGLDINLLRKEELLYRAFCLDGLIFFLDFTLGLALIIFSGPWIFYSNSFYVVCTLGIASYAVIFWIFSLIIFKANRSNLQDFLVATLLCAAGLSFPSVNLNGFEKISILILTILIILSIWIIGWASFRNETDDKKKKANIDERIKNILTISLVLISVTGLLFWFNKAMVKSNQNYLVTRFEAALQIPSSQVFPLNDLTFLEKDPVPIAFSLDSLNQLVSVLPAASIDSILIVKFNLRKHFYPKYNQLDSLLTTRKAKNSLVRFKYNKQELINRFYDSIYNQVIDKRQASKGKMGAISDPGNLRKYLHPLDYMASSLKELQQRKIEAGEMIAVSEELYRISLLNRIINVVNDKRSSRVDSIIPLAAFKFNVLKDRLREKYNNSRELRLKTSMVDALKLDSAQTLIYVKFHKLLYDNIEIEYNSLYAKTQIVYRSYLVDSQRVGVWAFLLSIIVIGLAAYFNSRDNHELMGPLGWPNEEGPKRAMDTPKNALFIQCLAIMILVVPLMRPIQPQNIDPEKSYWMISLQNWHAPTFIKSFSETDGEKKYQPGRTTVQTTVNNEISLNELKDEMQNISSGLGKNKISLDTIARKLERIRAQMANDINQKIDQ